MRSCLQTTSVLALCAVSGAFGEGAAPAVEAALPAGVRAVWDLSAAHRETTPTRERVCINGLWRWQPAAGAGAVPEHGWGYLKVPGCWPGITDYMQKDFQAVYAHPAWQAENLARTALAWYEREVTLPPEWSGRRIVLQADTVNSLASVFVDGAPAGDIRFPAGEVDLTRACRPGATHRLSLLVAAVPLRGVMLSFNDTNSAREVRGSVARRGLCGDVWLAAMPPGPRLEDVRVIPSVRNGSLTLTVTPRELRAEAACGLRARIRDRGGETREFRGGPFGPDDLDAGRFSFVAPWRPAALWDIHTPGNQFEVEVTLLDAGGAVLDTFWPRRCGFREFWIEGRDFFLNGTRVFLSAVPLDNAQVGALPAGYAGARSSLERLRSFGINMVYTHNYGCEPGAHLSFAEVLRAADDVGMLVALSQPHFGAYDWKSHDADRTNGYLEHAAHYARVAGSHPSVIAYATSHNATGYSEDMNPDRIDGLGERRDDWSRTNAELALRAQALITRADPSRLVYHHSSGNLGSMHTVNFYPNWAPVQELDDWFEHWATEGVKPVFLCEYGAPFGWDWTLYRGWYKGKRTFGSAVVPWDYCLAEWNAQFLGAAAFRSSEREAENIRWEAAQFRAGRLWHRWDYPYQVGERRIEEMEPVQSLYTVANWRAFRTWGLSANSPWEHHRFWRLRDGVDRGRRELPVDWEALQRPGFSPDFIDQQYERMDLAFEPADWIPTATATALIRNNGPLLAYIAGEAAHFTGKSHNFLPGETVEKQLVLINNSRETVACHCAWSLDLPAPLNGNARVEALPTGEQQRIPLRFVLPEDLAPRTYTLSATVRFDTGETQEDAFALDVLPAPPPVPPMTDVALLDPEGDTARLLAALGVSARPVGPGDDLAGVRVLILGRRALRVDGPGPDLAPVRDGLRVIVFEQRADVLEGRLGFRIAEYGLRQVFPRVPDHPLLAGLGPEHLRDWRGEATLLPPRLGYEPGGPYSGAPTVRWCGLEVPRLWRCGCRGSVASVLIEKPARGDFLPICDGGFSLQYSPLLEYREGRGMILFCQMDVTARSESDPAADTLVRNILRYADTWRPHPVRQVVHAGAVDGLHHLAYAGIAVQPYDGGAIPPDRILIVGAGAPAVPARGDVSAFLDGGGRLLALGLDAGAVDAFLPGAIRTEPGEHIATWFEPFPSGSPLAGISPADVHNRDPRTLPLVVGGATPFGNGVLAGDRDGDTVYCQLTPYRMASPPAGAEESPRPRETDAPPPTTALTEHHPLRRTYRRASYLLTRLLANMGAPCHTPLLSRFGTPPRSGEVESVLRNGRFDTDADGDGMPDHWEFSADAEGAACTLEAGGPDPESRALRLDCAGFGAKGKGSVMLAQHGVPVIEGQWYRIALRARGTGFGNGMVTVALQDTTAWKALLEYQRFCPSPAWKEVEFLAQARGTATERTRFQIWHGSTGTLWLADVRLTPCDPPETGRWNEGLYVDQAREWDDPYRFFRW